MGAQSVAAREECIPKGEIVKYKNNNSPRKWFNLNQKNPKKKKSNHSQSNNFFW